MYSRGNAAGRTLDWYFENYYEFREALGLLEADENFRDALGANGQRFYEKHYRWPVIEEKYNRILFDLEGENEKRSR